MLISALVLSKVVRGSVLGKGSENWGLSTTENDSFLIKLFASPASTKNYLSSEGDFSECRNASINAVSEDYQVVWKSISLRATWREDAFELVHSVQNLGGGIPRPDHKSNIEVWWCRSERHNVEGGHEHSHTQTHTLITDFRLWHTLWNKSSLTEATVGLIHPVGSGRP